MSKRFFSDKVKKGLVGAVALLGIGVVLFYCKESLMKPAEAPSLDGSNTSSDSSMSSNSQVVPSQLSSPTQASAPSSGAPSQVDQAAAQPPSKNFEDIKKKFGMELKGEFSEEGQLVSIQGRLGAGTPAGSDFRPDDGQKAIARAREVLSAASQLLKLNADWPLENAASRGSSLGAQVFFNEAYQGTPLYPSGEVKVVLGAKGELVGLYSNYVSNISIQNQAEIGAEEAKSALISSDVFRNIERSDVKGGAKVIWTQGLQGFYAFHFTVNGFEVMVNSQDAKILSKKDRRQY